MWQDAGIDPSRPGSATVNLQPEILADVVRRERALEASPARAERRRLARLAEAVARCCRPTAVARLRALLRAGRPAGAIA